MKKDIKVKPTNTKPKILEKASNLPKDAKTIMREHLVSQTENLKPEFKDKSQQNETNYATDKIESGMQRATNETIHAADKAKDFAVNKIKEHRAEKAQQNDIPQQTGQQSQTAGNTPKTKEYYQQPTEHSSAVPTDRTKQYGQQKQADKIKTRKNIANVDKSPTTAENKIPVKTKKELLSAVIDTIKAHTPVLVERKNQCIFSLSDQRGLTEKAAEIREHKDYIRQNQYYLNSLYESLVNGDITSDEYKNMRDSYSLKIADATEKIKAMELEQAELEKTSKKYYDLSETANQALKNGKLTKEIVDKLIDKIYVYKGRQVEIVFNFNDELQSEVAVNV